VRQVIPDTLEKIFPANNPEITDYAAARWESALLVTTRVPTP
jgi:hypothetical protein